MNKLRSIHVSHGLHKTRIPLTFLLLSFFLLSSFLVTGQNDKRGAVCTSVDFEENFGTGTGLECDLMGATTTYACWDGIGQLDDGEYILSNEAGPLNNGWHPDMEDHTTFAVKHL